METLMNHKNLIFSWLALALIVFGGAFFIYKVPASGSEESFASGRARLSLGEEFEEKDETAALSRASILETIEESVLQKSDPTPVLAEEVKGVAFEEIFSAKAFYVKPLSGESHIFAKEEFMRWPLASLTKLLTAVVAKENFGFERPIYVSEAAISTEGVAGDLRAGESYLSKDLIYALLLASSNDAAFALEEAMGSIRFMQAMQEKASELGMSSASFTDTSGLSSLNQASLLDVFLLVKYIYSVHPEILQMTREKERAIYEIVGGRQNLIKSIHPYSGQAQFLGGKTGYTEEASGNLVSLFEADEKVYFVGVFGSSDRQKDTELLYSWLKGELAKR